MAKRLTITIPDELYNQICEQAARDMRTISNEVTYLLTTVPSTNNFFIPHNTPGGIATPENPTGQLHTPTAQKPFSR